MTNAGEHGLWEDLEQALTQDDEQAAQSHLAAGRPVHYCDDRHPDAIVREWPDGRRELIAIDSTGHVRVVRSL